MIREDILGYGLSQFHTKEGFWGIELESYEYDYTNHKNSGTYSVVLMKDHISKEVLNIFRNKTIDEVIEIVTSGEY